MHFALSIMEVGQSHRSGTLELYVYVAHTPQTFS